MENGKKSDQEIAQEILANIIATTPISVSVDFNTKTVTETFSDGKVITKQIDEENPKYTFEMKVTVDDSNK